MGARAEVPAVEMSAEEDDLSRQLSACDLADHVGRRHPSQIPAIEAEGDAEVLLLLEQRAEDIGVRSADRRRGDLRGGGLVLQHPGMGMAVLAEGQRTDENGRGAAAGRRRGPGHPLVGGAAVSREGVGQPAVHGPVEEDDLPFERPAGNVQFVEGHDLDHRRGDPAVGRSHAPAEGADREGDAQAPPRRRDVRRGDVAADPTADLDGLGVDVGETHLLHEGGGQADRCGRLRRAGQARPDRRDPLQQLEGLLAGQPGVAQPVEGLPTARAILGPWRGGVSG
jgi:hypothetical protein